MTDQSMGSGFNWFVGTVVNRTNDPMKAGRAQIRIKGVNDDKSGVPDSDLFYAYPMTTIHSASMNGIGQSPTGGIIEGSTVIGFWADHDKTIPIMIGTMHRSNLSDTTSSPTSGSVGSGGTSLSFAPDTAGSSTPPNDVNVNGRSTQDFNQVVQTNMPKLAANNSLFNTLKSIGTYLQGNGTGNKVLGSGTGNQSQGQNTMIQNLINQIDSKNDSGSVIGGPNIAKSALALAGSGGDGSSLQSLMSLIQQFFTQSFAQNSGDTGNPSSMLDDSTNTNTQYITNLYIANAGLDYSNTDTYYFSNGYANGIMQIVTDANGSIIAGTYANSGIWSSNTTANQVTEFVIDANNNISIGSGAYIDFQLMFANN